MISSLESGRSKPWDCEFDHSQVVQAGFAIKSISRIDLMAKPTPAPI
jgi:hypothetical protein